MSCDFKISTIFKTAFTLAEVIIVVGIIGIIAQMAIPTVLRNIQNEELHSLFKKTYSELNQIAIQFKNDNGISASEYSSANSVNFRNVEFYKYLKDINKIYSPTSSYDSTYGLRPMISGVAVKNICDVTAYYSEISGKIYTFNDGNAPRENGPTVCVDINGKKNPNRYGIDFFLFVFTIDGRVIPMGMENQNNTTNTEVGSNFFLTGSDNCRKSSGYYSQFACAYYALLNQHPTDAGKDYWHDFLGGK